MSENAMTSEMCKEALFQNIISTTQTAIFWKDKDRRFLGANRAFLDYYGFADESAILGKNDEDMGWHTNADPFKNDELRVLHDGISTYRVRGKCMARGQERDIVASKSPLMADGQIVGLVGSFEDVTDEVRVQARLEEQKRAALEKQRRFYSKIVQEAKLSTWEYDIAHHTIVMSKDELTQSRCAVLGLPQRIENVPASVIPWIIPEDRQTILEMYRAVEEGRNASCEVWYLPVTGREPRCERITYIVADHPDGKPVKAIGFTQNITADRKVEERYQRELGYLRQTDENNLVAKGHYNLTENVVLEYTTKNDNIFKVEPGSSYDDAFLVFTQMPYQESERAEIADKLSRDNLARRYQQGQLQTTLTYRRMRAGALPIWITMNVHTYMSPDTGDLESFSYAYDVSDKMEIDRIMGLIAAEEFDYIGLIFAETREFEFLKKSASITFPDERVRTDYDTCCWYVRSNFVAREEQEQFAQVASLEKVIAGLHEKGRYVSTYRRKENGRVLCKQLDYAWLDEQAKVILVVRTDVTVAFEREQEQMTRIEAARLEADRANEAKSTFLSSMSHDLRTPLSGIIGFTQLALQNQDPAKKQEYLQKIDSAGQLLLDLVNDTLELSRIESGKAELQPEAVAPRELIPAVVTALRPSAELKQIRLETDFPDMDRSAVWCDKLKVQKIALNLISNAIKYTPQGGLVSVRVTESDPQDEKCRWTLCVTDNGIGMSREFMQRMFEPFAQEKRSESLKTPGTGLGLAIVKRYVDLMDGTIEVESKLHEGTSWKIALPIWEVPDGRSQKKESEAAIQRLAGKHILLCEDNDMNTEIATMLLKDRGVAVDAAENGRIGVEKFMAAPAGTYDAILMDLRMPVMDGNTAARRIRACGHADAAAVPIIAMTADAFEESVRESQEAGMNGYVTKPIEPKTLFQTISELIQKREQQKKRDENEGE